MAHIRSSSCRKSEPSPSVFRGMLDNAYDAASTIPNQGNTLPSESPLFEPVSLGALRLPNRMVMAPLTRSRAPQDGRPGPAARLYYAQRASAGLIVSEGVCISPEGTGNPFVPGIWNDDHVAGWKEITDAVHDAGGRIVAQLWHTGRASHPSLQPGGKKAVAPSAIAIDGQTFARDGRVPHEMPRTLETEEIPDIVAQYRLAAQNADRAGFDGVELHSANGYLIDQFLQNNANKRDDRYGGPITNRARLLFEVLDELTSVFGSDRVGVRLSPSSTFQDMDDSDPTALFDYVFRSLSPLGLAYVHVVEPGIAGSESVQRSADAIDSAWVRARYSGNLVAVGNFDRERAERVLTERHADAVAFGRAFLANPDLPRRFAEGAALNEAQRPTFYGGDERGYIDYPSLDAEQQFGELRRKSEQHGPDDLPPAKPLNSTSTLASWETEWAVQQLREQQAR